MTMTMKQMTLAAAKGFEVHGRATRKAEFLARMEALVPWAEFCALIEPYYPKAGGGRPPRGMERMLRMYCIAIWFNLGDEACEDALYDIAAFRDFCGIDLGRERVPDATTLLNFRHLLEEHRIGAVLFAKIGELLLANGMKLHIGVDSQSGLIHSASITAGYVHDSQELPNLLHGGETRLYGDSAYRGDKQRKQLKDIAPRAKDFTNKRAYRSRPLTEADKETNRRKSSVRSKVEHPFLTLKRIWGFAKVRYRGLAKNANRAFAMLALINLSKWGRPLTGQLRPA